MTIETLAVGPLMANCYLVGCEETAAGFMVDAADEPERLRQALERSGLRLEAILQTHGHPDHIAALGPIIEATGATLYLHPAEAAILDEGYGALGELLREVPWPLPYRPYDEGDELRVGDLSIRVLHTPGHSPGSVCLQVGDALFSGDTLFAGGVGRWDLPGGEAAALSRSLLRLIALPDDTRVLPGHGPATILGREKRENAWLSDLPGGMLAEADL